MYLPECDPHRKANRLKNWDYASAGYYFITFCTKDKAPLFWQRLVGASCARPALSKLGMVAEKELSKWNDLYPSIELDKYVIMPNHIHLILMLQPIETGRAQLAPTVSRIIQQFKGAVTKRAGYPLWQKSFHDHVIRDESDYLRVWTYIDTNPAKWREDRYYKE